MQCGLELLRIPNEPKNQEAGKKQGKNSFSFRYCIMFKAQTSYLLSGDYLLQTAY